MFGRYPGPDSRRIFHLRLFAWRRTISPDKDRIATAEPYDCARDCQTSSGEWRDDVRRSRGCALAGVHPVERKPTARALYQIKIGSAYMGRYRDRSLKGEKVLGLDQRPETPFEDPAIGCPGAWYRTPFVDSIFPFLRHRTREGGRVDNPAFTRADWQTQQAVMQFELEEERALAFIESAIADKARKDHDERERRKLQ